MDQMIYIGLVSVPVTDSLPAITAHSMEGEIPRQAKKCSEWHRSPSDIATPARNTIVKCSVEIAH